MDRGSCRKPYRKPRVTTEKVFEQAALSCVVRSLVNPLSNTLKLGITGGGGCGFTSS